MIRRPSFLQLLTLALLAHGLAHGQSDTFPQQIRPLLQKYCVSCHSTAQHTGDVDLERFGSSADVLRDPSTWLKVVEQLQVGEMPPKVMPQPGASEKSRLLSWIDGALRTAARAQAGDPGPVVLRRLNNAEYTFTVRDLTDVASLDPAKEFPADGAAGEGFMNTGNALSMSPSLVTKYLDAGKAIASHAVLQPNGIRFSAGASRRDWTNEILADIRKFYSAFTEAGGAETVTQQGIELDKNKGGALPLRRYLNASLTLLGPAAPGAVERVARAFNLSPKYLGALVTLLKGNQPSPLLDHLRSRWRAGNASAIDAMLQDIGVWQGTLWKFSSVGHIGKVDGPKAWMEPVDPIVGQQPFRVKLAAPANGEAINLYLAAHDAGDGQAGDVVVWQEPKLVIPGRPPVPLRDIPAFVEQLSTRRSQILAATARSLLAADETAGAEETDDARQAWFRFLGVRSSPEFKLDLFTKKIEKSGTYEFVQGWGTTQLPMLLANSSNQHVRIPGNMKAHGVAVHPSPTLQAAVGWRSPVAASLRIEGAVTRAHAECGNGVTWSLELRRGGARQRLANGEARNASTVALGPFEGVRVQPGDLISVLIGPREGNHSCDLTDIDLRLTGPSARWSLTDDVAPSVLAANPHGVWHFYTEPVADASVEALLPADSLLARWQTESLPQQRRQLAEALQNLLAAPAPTATDTSADAVLYRQLHSLAGPLFAAPLAGTTLQKPSPWGLPAAAFGPQPHCDAVDPASLCVRAPSVLELRLPPDLVANSEFVTTGTLHPASGAEGSVQLEVLTQRPVARSGLLPTGTSVADAQGTWTSNNQVVTYGMPVVVHPNSAARKRIESRFHEFRQMFPPALCYTKIVPVDEVVTLTLFHREDDHLSRLVLNEKQKAELNRLWDELHFVSRDALTLVDAFEQLWQFATQDADPSKFEPLRQPILARAEAFRQRLIDAEPHHVDAVLEFAARAYRRPLRMEEKTGLRDLYQKMRRQEMPHEEAIRLLLARVLVAPAFLYRTETAAPGRQAAPVGDYELASRLSYFLWSSMPDPELRAAAASGKLRTPSGLQAQAHRMLRDPRVRRLATEFGAAWLHIHDFESTDEKSERHFPEFRDLRGAMYEEPIRFFADLFANNGGVLSLLDANHTFVNDALAKHYGIPGVTGPEWRRVDGIRQHARGGVLGHAAVLAQQSGASRTSPILRGNWILEVLLGERSPRPPKDVPQLPVDEAAETLTVRELTEKHTADPRCAGCHARIDPFGYTLERYDAIGRHRDKDLGNRPINDRARVKDGTDLQGLEGLRTYLLTKGRSAFVRQFSKKLLGYALGRAVQLSDEPLLTDMQTRLAATGYPVRTVVDMIVGSRQFREIRGRDHEQEQQ